MLQTGLFPIKGSEDKPFPAKTLAMALDGVETSVFENTTFPENADIIF